MGAVNDWHGLKPGMLLIRHNRKDVGCRMGLVVYVEQIGCTVMWQYDYTRCPYWDLFTYTDIGIVNTWIHGFERFQVAP